MRRIYLLYVLILLSWKAVGQQDSTIVELGEVMIHENRMEIPFSKTSRNISVILRKEIETNPGRSLQELLAFVPGVDVRQRGVSGVQADIGIRGGGFEQTLMLINGIKLTDPQTGHHMMNIPLPLTAIQRVEVLKGPGARIFGQNAYTGAVNIITQIPDSKSLQIQGFGGDFGMRGGNLVAALPIGKYRQTLAISHDAADGHWANSDFKVSNVFYEAGYQVNAHHELRAMGGYTDRTFGANGFYTDAFPEQWESIQTALAALSHKYQIENLNVQTRAYWRSNWDEFRLKRFEPAFFTNNHQSQVHALEVNAAYDSKWGTTGLGIEGRQEGIVSNNLGVRNRKFLGVFAEHRIVIKENFDLRAGLYSNYYNEYKWKHFPGAELGYQLNRHNRIYTNYGASFRIPSFTDLYYEDRSNVSNPNLLPEEAQNVEIGWKYQESRFSGELVVFNRTSKNLIDWNREPSTQQPNPNRWTPRNVSSVAFLGTELAIAYKPDIGSKAASLKELSISYNYIRADLDQAEGVESRYSLNSLRQQLIFGTQAEFFQKAELTIKGRYLERMAMDPFFVLDSRLDFNRLKTYGLFVEVSNITNTDYVEAGFVQMPGRWVKAGFLIRID
jgi:vitamin B12 transporter